jgi:transposase
MAEARWKGVSTMPRPLSVRRPRVVEVRRLEHLLEGVLRGWQRRRAEAILLYAAGLNATEIAAFLKVHVHTVYADLHAFHREGLRAVRPCRRQGAPARLTAAQRDEIGRLAEIPPYELGEPYGRWSLAHFRDYLIARGVVERISREHLRRVLEKRGSTSAVPSPS